MIRLASALLLLFTATSAFAGERTVTLSVENMTCALCPITVRKAIENSPGVLAVEVDLQDQIAVVTFDDTLGTVAALAEASANAGYPAHPVQ